MKRLPHLALSDEGLVFDPTTGGSYVVSPTARLILKGLKNGESPSAIAAFLAGEFEVGEDEAEEDVVDFIEQLQTYGLR